MFLKKNQTCILCCFLSPRKGFISELSSTMFEPMGQRVLGEERLQLTDKSRRVLLLIVHAVIIVNVIIGVIQQQHRHAAQP